MRFSLKSTHRLWRDPGFGNSGLKKAAGQQPRSMPKSANGLGQQARLSSTVNALTQIAPERASAKSRKPVQPRQTADFAGQRQ
jgi:hypothetical protein